jgi:dienelactone hydrolase
MWWSFVAPAVAAGPFVVGHVDRRFQDPVAQRVDTRVYFPATAPGAGAEPDLSAGPYPLAVFLHGWLGQAWMYDAVCEELASWGYVVVSLDTETGLILDMDDFADDGVAALHGVEAAAADPADPLAGMVSGADWTAMGHSMGGATLSHLVGLEPRIRTAVAFMPYEGWPAYYRELGAWDGAYLLLSGTNDTTAPVALQREWFVAAEATRRSLWVTVTGMGHQAPTDLTSNEDPMPDDVQRDVVSRLASTFVRAEHGGEEDLWAELIGPGTDALDATFASRSHEPALWATLDAGVVDLGVAGPYDAAGEVFFGSAPTEDGLADAVSAGALDLATGVARATVPVPAGWAGDLYVRVRTEGDDGPAWTRPVPLITGTPVDAPDDTGTPPTTGAPDPTDPTATDPTATDPAPDRPRRDDPSGCATGPSGGPWALAALLLLRRRR